MCKRCARRSDELVSPEAVAACIAARVLRRSRFPAVLRHCAQVAPTLGVTVRGNVELLECRLVGFFSSESSPGEAIVGTYDLALALRESSVTFIGGFQSSMEREFLTFVLRGSARVVVCPAREIGRMRLPGVWRSSLETGQMLVLSVFDDRVRRATGKTAAKRNALVVDLAGSLLVPHAEPGGKAEGLCEAALAAGKPVFTLPSQRHRLGELGATEAELERLPGLLTSG